MSFITTTTAPATNAKVTVKFAGLMLLKPNENNGCDIGIHRLSETHALQVILVVSKPDRPPGLIRLVTGALTQPFAINVNQDPNPGVKAFTRGPDPFDPNRAGNNELDFRWAINMRQLHEGADFNDGARPVATLNAGTLYTSNLTPTELTPELVNGTKRTPLPRFSADLAAAIDLPVGGTVELSWTVDGGERRSLNLPRRNDPARTTYTVTLLNDPPVVNALAHDELSQYYQVLEVAGQMIPLEKQFRIAYNGDPNTDEIPCMPVVLNPPRN
jgi:hypothetical protein